MGLFTIGSKEKTQPALVFCDRLSALSVFLFSLRFSASPDGRVHRESFHLSISHRAKVVTHCVSATFASIFSGQEFLPRGAKD